MALRLRGTCTETHASLPVNQGQLQGYQATCRASLTVLLILANSIVDNFTTDAALDDAELGSKYENSWEIFVVHRLTGQLINWHLDILYHQAIACTGWKQFCAC